MGFLELMFLPEKKSKNLGNLELCDVPGIVWSLARLLSVQDTVELQWLENTFGTMKMCSRQG